MWDISCFAMAGAENKGQAPDDESKQKKIDGADGAIGAIVGADETKEDPEEAASPKP